MFIQKVISIRPIDQNLVVLVNVAVPAGGWESDPKVEQRKIFFPVEIFLEMQRLANTPLQEILADQIAQRQGLLLRPIIISLPERKPYQEIIIP